MELPYLKLKNIVLGLTLLTAVASTNVNAQRRVQKEDIPHIVRTVGFNAEFVNTFFGDHDVYNQLHHFAGYTISTATTLGLEKIPFFVMSFFDANY